MVKHKNEDSCLVIPPWNSLALKRKACIFAVADGMGGHRAGELASSIAMRASYEWFVKRDVIEPDKSQLEEVVERANAAVWAYAKNHREFSGMGNTFTMVLLAKNRAFVAHVGDSRLYRLRDAEITQLTRDHTFVAEEVNLGFITPEQPMVYPNRNFLNRVMGCRQFITADIFEIELRKGDEFIICSDGVSGMIDDNKIKAVATKIPVACTAKKLVEAANEAGGKDNATAVVFALESLPITFPSLWSATRIKKLLVNNISAGGV